MKSIAIIPARGGSKRIPRKNVKFFFDKPIIGYAIDAAKESGLFEHVIVSTDDKDIARIAREYGAEVPFLRELALADDFVATIPVIIDAIKKCKDLKWDFDFVCCIYPCVPFIEIDDIKKSFEELVNFNSPANFTFPITKFPSVIERGFKLTSNKKIQLLYPDFQSKRTQDIDHTYYDAGQFYWGKVESWLTNKNLHNNSLGFIIPNWRVVDIDSLDDWRRAELLFTAIKNYNSEED